MNCTTCNKPISNLYYLDGKTYGYNCYKMALSLKLAHLQQLKNDEYSIKCFALISVFENKTFKDTWNNDFKTSILTQWNACNKLTGKQFNVIYQKLNLIESIEYNLLYIDMLEACNIDVKQQQQALYSSLYTQKTQEQIHTMFNTFKADERFLKVLKCYNPKKELYLINKKDIEDTETFFIVVDNEQLENYKNDEYTEILETIKL